MFSKLNSVGLNFFQFKINFILSIFCSFLHNDFLKHLEPILKIKDANDWYSIPEDKLCHSILYPYLNDQHFKYQQNIFQLIFEILLIENKNLLDHP